MKRRGIGATIASTVVAVFCVVAIAPLVWHGLSSLKTASEVSQIPPTIVPESPTLSNYEELFVRRPFGLYFLNSIVIASLATLLCLAVGSLAAYWLIRLPSRLRTILASGLLVLGFFPPIVFLFPLYELVQKAGAMNHPWALILPYAGLNLPLTIWLLAGYLQKIPRELEEAASIDGMTEFQTFRLILLPLAAPALATTGILVFIFCWNEFMFALTFMNLDSARTITVGSATLSGAFAYQLPWGLLAAGVVITALPLIVVVMLFQRRIVEGLTAGSLK